MWGRERETKRKSFSLYLSSESALALLIATNHSGEFSPLPSIGLVILSCLKHFLQLKSLTQISCLPLDSLTTLFLFPLLVTLHPLQLLDQ